MVRSQDEELQGTKSLAGRDDAAVLERFSSRVRDLGPMVKAKASRDRAASCSPRASPRVSPSPTAPQPHPRGVEDLRRRAKETEKRARQLGVVLPEGDPGTLDHRYIASVGAPGRRRSRRPHRGSAREERGPWNAFEAIRGEGPDLPPEKARNEQRQWRERYGR